MPFVPGQLVKCIDVSDLGVMSDGLEMHGIYTVRGVVDEWPRGHPGVWLEEIVRPTRPADVFGEVPYRASRFVPIDDKALDIFRQVLTDAPKDVETV